MEATRGRLLAKEGAEGVLCLASVEDDWGVAVKVEDGSLRAVGPVVVAVLDAAGMLTERERRRLEVLQDVDDATRALRRNWLLGRSVREER